MEKEMFQVKVYVSDSGNVCIEQEDPMTETFPVLIHPDQVPTIIKWMQEAQEEALGYEGPRIVDET